MIERYALPEIAGLFTDEARFRTWLEVEILATEAWAKLGVVPAADAVAVRERADFTVVRGPRAGAHHRARRRRLRRRRAGAHRRPGRPVAPLRPHVERRRRHRPVGDAGPGAATSCSTPPPRSRTAITAQARELPRRRRWPGAPTASTPSPPRSGRSSRSGRCRCAATASGSPRARAGPSPSASCRAPSARYSNVDPAVEAYVCERARARARCRPRRCSPATATPSCCTRARRWVPPIEAFALEIRHLQRTEVREVEEPFRAGAQKGSSAMPHKRNPVKSRAALRSRPRAARQPAGRARERRAVARARHLALVGGAHRPPRLVGARVLRAGEVPQRSSRACSSTPSACSRTSTRRTGSCSASRCCSRWSSRA